MTRLPAFLVLLALGGCVSRGDVRLKYQEGRLDGFRDASRMYYDAVVETINNKKFFLWKGESLMWNGLGWSKIKSIGGFDEAN